MSINKFIGVFIKNKPFFCDKRIENSGFWIFELLVSIVILMVITMFLFRFSCNMMSMEIDTVNRLMVIDCIASHLDGESGKKLGSGINIVSLGDNKTAFDIKSKVFNLNIIKSNLPESVKNWQKSSNFKLLAVSASYISAFGRENVVKILAKAPNGV